MRASVRMTRYLESWGAARPFAHLSHRESVSSDSSSCQGRRRKVSSHLGIGSRQLQTTSAACSVKLLTWCDFCGWMWLCSYPWCSVCTQNWEVSVQQLFLSELNIFRLPISLAYYNHSISSKQNYLFFLLFFHLDILPGTCGFLKKKNKTDALNT